MSADLQASRGVEDPRLFEFAVCRMSSEKYYAASLKAMDKRIVELDWANESEMPEKARINRYRIHQSEWAEYEYNEIVGWVRLTRSGIQQLDQSVTIKGYLWKREGRRISRNPRTRFEGSYQFTQFSVFHEQSREQIAATMRAEVSGLADRGRVFAGRHVDFEAYDSTAVYLDFRRRRSRRVWRRHECSTPTWWHRWGRCHTAAGLRGEGSEVLGSDSPARPAAIPRELVCPALPSGPRGCSPGEPSSVTARHNGRDRARSAPDPSMASLGVTPSSCGYRHRVHAE
jgi:hypothetical protein